MEGLCDCIYVEKCEILFSVFNREKFYKENEFRCYFRKIVSLSLCSNL